MVGADHVRASVHVEYDLSTSDDTEETYDPKTAATLTQQKSDENSSGGGPMGVPGTTSNLPTGAAATAKTGGQSETPPASSAAGKNVASSAAANVPPAIAPETESSHSESETYGVSKSVRHVSQPPGRIKRIAAAVLVDDAVEFTDKNGSRTAARRKRTPEEMKQIEQLAAAAIGLDTQRGDMVAIQNLSFQELPVEKPSPPGRIESTRRFLFQWSSLFRYLGVTALFAIVYFLLLRPVKKQLVIAFRELPERAAQTVKELKSHAAKTEVEIELPAGSPQAQRAQALKRQLSEKVRTEPLGASRLVQSWIREDAK